MTLETGRTDSGFSLLEVIISLGIIAILTTLFAVQFVGNPIEEELEAASAALQKFAQKGARHATAFHSVHSIQFDSESIHFAAGKDQVETYQLPLGVQFDVRRFGENEWRTPAENESWSFPPTGLCEPLSVRFSKEKAFIELSFDSLTARIQKENSFFP